MFEVACSGPKLCLRTFRVVVRAQVRVALPEQPALVAVPRRGLLPKLALLGREDTLLHLRKSIHDLLWVMKSEQETTLMPLMELFERLYALLQFSADASGNSPCI